MPSNRFLDVGAGAGSTYDPATRLLGSGSYNNYITLQAAVNAASTDDVIYLRSGTESPQGLTTINKALKIRSYGDEVHTLPVTGSVSGTTFTVAAADVDCGKGQFVIQAADLKTISHYAIQYSITGSKISGIDFRQWTGGTLIRHVNTTTSITMQRCIVGPGHVRFVSAPAAATNTLTANAFLFDRGITYDITNPQTLILNNPTFIGGDGINAGTPIIGMADSGLSIVITVNNPVVIGCSPADLLLTKGRFAAVGAGSSITINGGVTHRNLKDRSATYNNRGTITNTANESALVKFHGNANRCFVTLATFNSSYMATGEGAVGNAIITAMAAYPGVKLSHFQDDWKSVHLANMFPNITNWLAAGFELNSLGMSGGDDWNTTNPMRVTFAGANNPRLVISNNGETWTVLNDLATLAGPYDCSYGGDEELLGLYQGAGGPGGDGTTVCERMETDVVGLTVTYNTGTTTGWDDTYASVFEDGTYALSGTPNSSMAVNATRRMETEIGRSATLCQNVFGIIPSCMYTVTATDAAKTAEEAYALGVGYRALMSGRRGMAANTINALTTNIYRVTTDDLLVLKEGPEASTELKIRAGARSLASYGFAIGAYIPMILSHLPTLGGGNPQWTAEEVTWLVDELVAAGVEIVTFAEAVALAGNVTITPITNFALAEGSAGWGTSTIFWTANSGNPTGMDGEPYSNFDTDCGAYQSKTGPFHPTQL